ncbi:MAG: hypothetical protein AAF957_04870 [Planctomycetota bacterium]
MTAMVVFSVATAILLQSLAAGHGLRGSAQEEWLATSIAQNTLEAMRNEAFRDVVRMYDADPFNDPGGPGTAPGATFAVASLDPAPDDADGFVGEVLLPVVNVGSEVAPNWQVREDLGERLLGLPRDLTGDAIIDAANHADDYRILPVLVRVRWNGRCGVRELRFFTSLTEMSS